MNFIKISRIFILFGAIGISVVACNNADKSKNDNSAKEVEAKTRKAIQNVKEDLSVNNEDPKSTVYNETQVDVKAMFGDCSTAECSEKKMLAFVKENIEFPKNQNMLDESFEQVLVVINSDGSLGDVKYVASSNSKGCPVCQQAAVDVVGKMKNWKPAMKDGKAAPMKMTIPVRFVKS